MTQRGVNRQPVFFTAADRLTYLHLVAENQSDAAVSVIAYCLMGNHVHWIVVPQRADSLAVLFRRVHGRYAQYLNARRVRTGHLWQNRFYSCPLAGAHVWTAVRYVELNPVRARLVDQPGDYAWSTAQAHLLGPGQSPEIVNLDWEVWNEAGGSEGWRALLGGRESLTEVVELRRCTYSGKPYATPEVIEELAQKHGRQWKDKGRPRKPPKSEKEADRSASFLGLRKGVSSG
jgi:putative transposase